ncbi:MAG: sensor histidine kinase [Tessaracoccus sp.]|uniref:sensor histidine kinase n=1 Tax=Tessaracoccus sp. TaxID=1971211 RepID=UPI001ECCA3D3|nr:sensor histidine kinase [Tessaracoccus sp.]MBK7822581.1 sensor histidine kinase [Tessaracoccus sp.]
MAGEADATLERGWRHLPRAELGAHAIYLFVTGVLVLLTWQTVRRLSAEGHASVSAAVTVVVGLLVAAFWANGLSGGRRSWWPAYVAVQVLLVAVLIGTRAVAGVDVWLAEAALLCLAGEALGVWGNTRRGFVLAGAYLAAAAACILLFTPPADWALPLNQFGIQAATVIVLVILNNRAEAERVRAEMLAAQLRASSAQVADLTRRAERQRMARELHDTLAQGLTGIALQLEAARGHLARGNEARALAIVDQSLAGARSTLASSRRAIDDLRRNPDDLASEIGARAARFTRETGIRSTVEIGSAVEIGGETTLASETHEHLLRVLDETLANVARHADAEHVLVQFSDGAAGLSLQVVDDGCGFDQDAVGPGHYGLVGMRERAVLIGGALLVDSRPGRTVVGLEVRR